MTNELAFVFIGVFAGLAIIIGWGWFLTFKHLCRIERRLSDMEESLCDVCDDTSSTRHILGA